jgi:hypothetical protein
MKLNIRTIFAALLFVVSGTSIAKAQEYNNIDDSSNTLRWSALNGLEYEMYAGVNIGGTSPIPLPAEIREINGYNPMLNLAIGGNVIKWLDGSPNWGFSLGVSFENKGMDTKSTVKNYGMEIIQDGARIKGNWTGRVDTKYHSSLITIPLLVRWRPLSRWSFHAGPYMSFSLNHEFDGTVHNGYLREIDPTGTKAEFEGDAFAPYDFNDNLRTFQWGVQGGATWRAYKHLFLRGTLSWGCSDIFKSSFKTVSFALYPIYANIGFGYTF